MNHRTRERKREKGKGARARGRGQGVGGGRIEKPRRSQWKGTSAVGQGGVVIVEIGLRDININK